MSVMTMFEQHNINPNNYDYLATCGPSMKPLINYVQSHPNTDTIYLGFDNDEAGNKYRQRARKALSEIGYSGKVIDKPPHTKDFNQDVQLLKQHNGTISQQNTIQNNNFNIERMIQR